jgi:hypothetical protein
MKNDIAAVDFFAVIPIAINGEQYLWLNLLKAIAYTLHAKIGRAR